MRSLLLCAVVVVAACSSSDDTPSPQNTSTQNQSDSGKSSSSGGTSSGDPTPPSGDDDDGGAPPAERPVDACDLKAAKCTAAPAGFKEGGGLAEVDRCAFALTESEGIATMSPVLAALTKITKVATVTAVLDAKNRDATKQSSAPGSPSSVQYAFTWQSDDQNSEAWTPQGITGSADATDTGKVGDKSAVLVSFYDEPTDGSPNNGVRIAFVDLTNGGAPRYRFALLVNPKGTADAPTFDPVKIHAGGIVWFRNYLYVADTTHGFRVFDMRNILEVNVAAGDFGCNKVECHAATYRYVIPQIGTYSIGSACSPIFSSVSLDRKSDPPALVSSEYCATTACSGPLAGRVYRWPLDLATGLLRSKVTFPTEAYLMGQKQVQGAAAVNGTYYLSSSAPAADGGALYRILKGKSATSQWGNNPEDVMVDSVNGWLWNLTEKAGSRSVYAVKLAAYPPPL